VTQVFCSGHGVDSRACGVEVRSDHEALWGRLSLRGWGHLGGGGWMCSPELEVGSLMQPGVIQQ
jgi:hypothetical protein